MATKKLEHDDMKDGVSNNTEKMPRDGVSNNTEKMPRNGVSNNIEKMPSGEMKDSAEKRTSVTHEERNISGGQNADITCNIVEINDTYATNGIEDVKTTLKVLLETVYSSKLPKKVLTASTMEAPNFLRLPLTEVTLAFIKPDAVRAGHAHEIRYAIESHGFIIMAETRVQLTRVRAEDFYEEHSGKPFFDRLTRFTSSGPLHAFILGKQKAVKEWHLLMGNKDPNRARIESPSSLRARFGTDALQNAVHGSFSTKDTGREIKFFFPYYVVDPVLDERSARYYFDKRLKPVLTKALTTLAYDKPSSEPLKVIKWFANWLQENNPNRPFIDGKRIIEIQ